ncbi:MAG: sugar phosphate isomerase/epimerase family protein [Pirellulaceae bacterium]
MKRGTRVELKIAIQLASLNLPFKKALHTAAELGARAVEIDIRRELNPQSLTQTGLREMRKILDDRNLRVCAVTFRTQRGYNVLEELDRRVAATKEALKFAYKLGAPVVVNQVGRVPDESQGPEWDLLVQVLSDLGHFSHHIGAWLAAETGSEEPANLARLIQALPAGAIAVTLDPGNLVVNGFSVRSALASLGRHVLHVHAKDGVRDLAQGRGIEVPLGRGSVDFPDLIASLEEHDFRGYYTIERERCANPVLEIGQAVQYLRSL